MADWTIERLDRSHDRAEFDCGVRTLDDFIRRFVGQYEKRNLGRTYVAVDAGDRRIGGYYTLASASLRFQALPQESARKLPRHPVPTILIARLAVDKIAQGRGLGSDLLIDALARCLSMADPLGVHAVEVDAIDARAARFYAKHGFVPLLDDELHLYLPIATIRGLLHD